MLTTNRRRLAAGAVAVSLPALIASTSMGASHLWRFNEIFSNADGTIMFVEMKECCGADNETFLDDKWINSIATGSQYTFPNNLPCSNCTANKYLLLATQGFADLPGAPTPDFIIEPGFFSLNGDTLKYWFYTPATWTYGPNRVPIDGIHSLSRTGLNLVNSPTNFAGVTGVVTANCDPADVIADDSVDIDDLLAVINAWGPCPLNGLCSADIAPPAGPRGEPPQGDDEVNVDDLLEVINAWGSCQ